MRRDHIFSRPAPPFWFLLLLCALEALAWRALAPELASGAGAGGELEAPRVAFWFVVGLIASAIWTGVQVAAKVTLTILAWSVKALWAFAIAVHNGAVAIGKSLITIGQKAWTFLRLTYDEVLKPAWQKFWGFVDKLRGWLERTFAPVFDFLEKIRSYVLRFYDTWVRPILDAIGIARRVLNVLASLGLDWARALDERLRWLEEKIEAPFRLAIAKINEVIGIVNRVVTADGLLQRLALIRSLERDIRQVSRAFMNWRTAPLTNEDFEKLRIGVGANRTEAEVKKDFQAAIEKAGPYRAVIAEYAQIWQQRIERR